MDGEKRQQFIETIYKILSAVNAQTVHDLTGDWLKLAGGIINSLTSIDNQTKKIIGKIIADFFRAAKREIKKELKKPTNRRSREEKGLLPATH
jgi:hypothetical protein